MSSAAERASNIAIAIAALTLAIVFASRELSQRNSARAAHPTENALVFVPEWKEILSAGIDLESVKRPVRILVFSDLECPYCAKFHLSTLVSLNKAYPGKVATTFVHYPIRSHRFSMQAAVALECAGEQGAHVAFLNAVYGKQDSIGLRSWETYARDASVNDTALFRACNSAKAKERIIAGRTWGERIELRATPTILVNGWRFSGVPDDRALGAAIDAILAGRDPVTSAPIELRRATMRSGAPR